MLATSTADRERLHSSPALVKTDNISSLKDQTFHRWGNIMDRLG